MDGREEVKEHQTSTASSISSLFLTDNFSNCSSKSMNKTALQWRIGFKFHSFEEIRESICICREENV